MKKRDAESPAVQLLRFVWGNEAYGWGKSWSRINSTMRKALELAITSGLRFNPDDFKTFMERSLDGGFSFGYWCGEGGVDRWYKLACKSGPGEKGNLSACQAIEKLLDRPPFILKSLSSAVATAAKIRLAIDVNFWWDGRWVTVTSFSGRNALIACSYKSGINDNYFHWLKQGFFRVKSFNEQTKNLLALKVDIKPKNLTLIEKRYVITRAQLEEHNKAVMAEIKKRKEAKKKEEKKKKK
jgi:hypothetical protein